MKTNRFHIRFLQALSEFIYNQGDDLPEPQLNDDDSILGTTRITAGSHTLIGNKTTFLSNLKVGKTICIDGHQYVIQSIEDDTHLTLHPAAHVDYTGWINLIQMGSYSVSMGISASGKNHSPTPAVMGIITSTPTV